MPQLLSEVKAGFGAHGCSFDGTFRAAPAWPSS